MRAFRDVAMASIIGWAVLAVVFLLSHALAAVPLGWLFGYSPLGLALAKYGPLILVPFLAMLLSMWVFLRTSHGRPSGEAQIGRHKA
jgi:hypothetical protein